MSTEPKSAAMAYLEDLADPLSLSGLLRSIRLGEEVSQADFARELGISRSHLCDIEKGRKPVSPRRAVRFARILGYSEAQFARLALQGLVEDAGLQMRVQLIPVPA